MKKLIFFLISGLVIVAGLKECARAQTISLLPRIGYSFDNSGNMTQIMAASNPKSAWVNPVYGIILSTTMPFMDEYVSVGVGMESGEKFSRSYAVQQYDSTVLLKKRFINAPAVYFTAMANLPEKKLLQFGGSGAGFSYGLAFPNVGGNTQANLFKIFLQLNYNFVQNENIGTDDGQAYHIGCFIRPSFNFLTMGEQIFGSGLEFGIRTAFGRKIDK